MPALLVTADPAWPVTPDPGLQEFVPAEAGPLPARKAARRTGSALPRQQRREAFACMCTCRPVPPEVVRRPGVPNP